MRITDYLKDNILYLDGAMGTSLQKAGLAPGEMPERWNLEHPDVIKGIHRDYFDAGSNVVYTNTFGVNSLRVPHEELSKIVKSAVRLACEAREESDAPQEKWVGLDIGPSGKMLKPYGDLSFEDAVELFAEIVREGAGEGADLISIETMNDSYETKAALIAAKENSDLPVFVTNAYDENGRLMTGASPETMTAILEGIGADAIGVNCSYGPDQLAPIVEKYLSVASVPVIMKPNAGLPSNVNGKAVYDINEREFSESLKRMLEKGVRIAGGCCGTTPDYIREFISLSSGVTPVPVDEHDDTVVTSYSDAVFFDEKPILIGERINPTGKKRLKDELSEGKFDFLLSEAASQEEESADVLDINVGVPGVDEAGLMEKAVMKVQAMTDLPLAIDTGKPEAMERALRIYNGKPLLNSVNGKEESMEAVLPLAAKYGSAVIVLTLDESGIPGTAEGRFRIAEKIVKRAAEYGIKPKDLIFDTLTLTVSSDKAAPSVTLESLSMIRERLGCRTSLGVSNVSFGMPDRELLNRTFFVMALEKGLSAAILNTGSRPMMDAYYAFTALSGKDSDFSSYMDHAEKEEHELQDRITYQKEQKGSESATGSGPVKESEPASGADEGSLEYVIEKGIGEKAGALTEKLLKDHDGLDIISGYVIPALDKVGKGFEEKKIYLPQLLMSAEAAEAAFDVIKHKAGSKGKTERGLRVVIATVKGDIHDIGKNIVKLLLENYGFEVTDLGKDVDPEVILEAVEKEGADVLGLSALMTTSVESMKDTIAVVKERVPGCTIMVGGAVLTESYAKDIGADFYGSDAMASVRFCESIDKSN